jgi:predicted ATPase/DNA-binding winged helix-turn-helix (wHTH) protein
MTPDANIEYAAFGPFRLYPSSRKLLCGNDDVKIGDRAMDLLIALAKNKGELINKKSLMAAAWPSTFVDDSNLKVTIAGMRKTLREYSPDSEFIRTVVGRGYWLSAETLPDAEPIAPKLTEVSGTGLPKQGSVIGRDDDIAILCQTMGSHRITTVVGAGGIGKTTVAVAAAQRFEDEQGVAATFVDLSRVASEEFVAVSLAAALGINSEGGDPLQAVTSILARRKALLVLDTCEHVLHAVAHICDVIVARTSDVWILATSREVLRFRQEKTVWLPPLSVPPVDHEESLRDVLNYSAPQLLVERALETTGYRAHDGDARALADICRRLDGSPLAIELVSSRLAGRTAAMALRDLDDRFRTLRQHRPGAPLRQQTLLITLEWSYALLNREEATVLRATSIFAGPFDASAATRVVGHAGISELNALDALAGLRAKSMVSVDKTAGGLRYRLLDSTRAFAWSLLEGHGELERVSLGHARYALDACAHAGAIQATSAAHDWRMSHASLVDELRKALDWALTRSGDTTLGVHLAVAGLPLWQEFSMGEEGRRQCEQALSVFESQHLTDKALKLKLIVGLASLNAYLTTESDRLIALFEAASQLARETENADAECLALSALATFKLLPGQDDTVSLALDDMRDAAERAHDRAAMWEQEKLRAWLEVYRCQFELANQRLIKLRKDMRGQAEGTTPRFHVDQKSSVDIQYGALQWLMGRPGHSIDVIEETARYAVAHGHGLSLVHALSRGIIFAFLECGLHDRARHYSEMLKAVIIQHGLATWLPLADCYSESIHALSGTARRPAELRAALNSLKAGSAQLGNTTYCATLARAMLAIDQPDDAADALAYIHVLGAQRWNMPELLRIEVAIDKARGIEGDHEIKLRKSLQLADEISCHAWRLRSGIDLACHLIEKGARLEARQVLHPIYDFFTDGFDTEEVIRAGHLLQDLSA